VENLVREEPTSPSQPTLRAAGSAGNETHLENNNMLAFASLVAVILLMGCALTILETIRRGR
jgi:hypothetical protein